MSSLTINTNQYGYYIKMSRTFWAIREVYQFMCDRNVNLYIDNKIVKYRCSSFNNHHVLTFEPTTLTFEFVSTSDLLKFKLRYVK